MSFTARQWYFHAPLWHIIFLWKGKKGSKMHSFSLLRRLGFHLTSASYFFFCQYYCFNPLLFVLWQPHVRSWNGYIPFYRAKLFEWQLPQRIVEFPSLSFTTLGRYPMRSFCRIGFKRSINETAWQTGGESQRLSIPVWRNPGIFDKQESRDPGLMNMHLG